MAFTPGGWGSQHGISPGTGTSWPVQTPATLNGITLRNPGDEFGVGLTADEILRQMQFQRDDPRRQMEFQASENALNRQFQTAQDARNRQLAITQLNAQTMGIFSQMMSEAGKQAALKEFQPAKDYFKMLMDRGMYTPEQIESAVGTQFENINRGARTALDQAAAAQRAGGARSGGLLALNAGEINAQAIGAAGALRNQYNMQQAESRLRGAEGFTGVASQTAGLQAAPTQESASGFFTANTKLPEVWQLENELAQRDTTNNRISAWSGFHPAGRGGGSFGGGGGGGVRRSLAAA